MRFVVELTEAQVNTLKNGLFVALQRFQENAKELRQAVEENMTATKHQKVPPVHHDNLERLAEQFDRQAVETAHLHELLEFGATVQLQAEGTVDDFGGLITCAVDAKARVLAGHH